MKVVDALVKTGLCKSKNEARRLIEQGDARIEGIRITDVHAEFFLRRDKVLIIQKGKPINVSERGKSSPEISVV